MHKFTNEGFRKKGVLALRIKNTFDIYVHANSRAMYLVALNPAV